MVGECKVERFASRTSRDTVAGKKRIWTPKDWEKFASNRMFDVDQTVVTL